VSKTKMLVGWNTPRATDGSNGGPSQTGGALSHDAALTGWPTPNAAFQDGDPAKHLARKIAAGVSKNPVITDLSMQARALAAWPTPEAEESRRGYQNRSNGKKGSQESMTTVVVNALGHKPHLASIPQHARLTHLGQMQIGYGAGMKNGGQLNPEHSRWLMGIPHVWAFCAPTGTRSSRKSLKT